jgi:hypothetical protein
MRNPDKYYLGKVCEFHPELKGERFKSQHRCIECHRFKLEIWRIENPDKISGNNRYQRDPEYEKQRKKAWHEANRPKVSEYSKNYRLDHYDKYLAHCSHQNTVRKRLIGGQVLSKAYSKEIKKIYENCPEGHHVDHKVPLRGEKVSGLHVPWNLQYLPSVDNIRKSNHFDVQ